MRNTKKNRAKITYYWMPQRSPAWYAIRENKWTGSTIIELLKGKNTIPEFSDYDNLYMRRGRMLESLAVEAYQQVSDYYKNTTYGKVKLPGFITNSEYPNAGYSPDGIYGRRVLEVKCLNVEKHDSINTYTDLPVEYQAQVQMGLLITEFTTVDIILYNPDSTTPIKIITAKRDKKVQANIEQKLLMVAKNS